MLKISKVFRRDTDSIQRRQSLRDQGCQPLQLVGLDEPVYISVRDGPGRLPSTLTKLVIQNLPGDFMIPGVADSLLQSAGYTVGDSTDGTSIAIRSEFGGEHSPMLAAMFPRVAKFGVVVAIVRAPADDPGLRNLPRQIADEGSVITIAVTGRKVPISDSTQPPESVPLPGFTRASARDEHQPRLPVPRDPHTRLLDPLTDPGTRMPRDRRGLGEVGQGTEVPSRNDVLMLDAAPRNPAIQPAGQGTEVPSLNNTQMLEVSTLNSAAPAFVPSFQTAHRGQGTEVPAQSLPAA